ncbi:MAG: phosphoribosyl-AMP cyclohydrolase [Lachnospiraceae bacterium]|jgi:phosphoribosyl-ATP pyrophosphohydrolase/phosphoribosyl-AMP cyclohydrolase|nr:phosphoribosyl-AMP cyclohydrolase [Lachnospiraceae bacterium]
MEWSELKKNADGLVPCIVQDSKNGDVLMMAWMNEESFQKTIAEQRMCYWSRSRKELWIKGMTSGHFQYVKELYADCDSDTLLAKVEQIGAACHTGSRSCFFKQIL